MYCGFVAGLVGGVLSMFIGYPFDTIKVYQQTHPKLGMITCARNIMMTLGPFGLFRGMGLPMASSGIINSMFFGSYEFTARLAEGFFYKERLDAQLAQLLAEGGSAVTRRLYYSDLSIIIGGCVAGASQIFVGCPVELIKIKLQTGAFTRPGDILKEIGSFELARKLIESNGVRALYQGSALMLLREMPSSVVYMMTYQKLTIYLRKRNLSQLPFTKNNSSRNFVISFLSGGSAGTLAAFASVPFDVVKSRIQANSFKTTSGMAHHFAALYREQGLAGFTRGLIPLTIRAFPVNGAAFVAYELFMKICNNRNLERLKKKIQAKVALPSLPKSPPTKD